MGYRADSAKHAALRQGCLVLDRASCDGRGMADTSFAKSYASSGISAHVTQCARSRNIKLNSRVSLDLNWSLCDSVAAEFMALLTNEIVAAAVPQDCGKVVTVNGTD